MVLASSKVAPCREIDLLETNDLQDEKSYQNENFYERRNPMRIEYFRTDEERNSTGADRMAP